MAYSGDSGKTSKCSILSCTPSQQKEIPQKPVPNSAETADSKEEIRESEDEDGVGQMESREQQEVEAGEAGNDGQVQEPEQLDENKDVERGPALVKPGRKVCPPFWTNDYVM
jgi:hypothetical protein